jgi:hypothetical protein
MRGQSRPKDGVASLAYDPRIHPLRKTFAFLMDCRVTRALTPVFNGLIARQ